MIPMKIKNSFVNSKLDDEKSYFILYYKIIFLCMLLPTWVIIKFIKPFWDRLREIRVPILWQLQRQTFEWKWCDHSDRRVFVKFQIFSSLQESMKCIKQLNLHYNYLPVGFKKTLLKKTSLDSKLLVELRF